MSTLDELKNSIPIGDIAQRLGVDEATASSAIDQALPTLVAGLGANAQKAKGAASLENALANHSPSLVAGGVNLDDVNEDDGQKIVNNIFGKKTSSVVSALDTHAGAGNSGMIAKLLPMLAPIVMSFLASKFNQGGTANSGGIGNILGGLMGGGGLGGLLGGLGGGASASGGLGGLLGGAGGAGGGLGDALGGLLGGGAGTSSGLGGLLGGLFGKK